MSPRVFSTVLFMSILNSYKTAAQFDGQDGMMTFWGDKNFKGAKYQVRYRLEPQYCYNNNVGEPSSITWKNQVKTGMFNGKAKIAFYNKKDCKGKCLSWFTTTKDFPANLEVDHFDNQIKSFMIWQTGFLPDVIVRQVPLRRLRTGD